MFRLKKMMLMALLMWSSAAMAGEVAVHEAWLRLPPPASETAAVYMVVHNGDHQSHRLVGVRSPVASSAMFHAMRHEHGRMHMAHLQGIDLAAGQRVVLAPGGLHVMLVGLQRPLHAGDQVELWLQLEDGSELRVLAPVRDMR